MTKKKYYDVLGLSENASEAEIKVAYRKSALKWHPDRWASKSESEKQQAEEKMKEINQAYSVLSDGEKRKSYDRYGNENAFDQGANSSKGFGGEDDFFKDIFGAFFGRDAENTRHNDYAENSSRQQAGKDILIELTLTFKESILGTKKKSFS